MPINFDRAKETVWGTPGFVHRRSTVASSGLAFIPQASYIVTTTRNDEGWMVFLEWVEAEGGQRVVLPDKVVRALFRHYESIMAKARQDRAKHASQTRALKKQEEKNE